MRKNRVEYEIGAKDKTRAAINSANKGLSSLKSSALSVTGVIAGLAGVGGAQYGNHSFVTCHGVFLACSAFRGSGLSHARKDACALLWRARDAG